MQLITLLLVKSKYRGKLGAHAFQADDVLVRVCFICSRNKLLQNA